MGFGDFIRRAKAREQGHSTGPTATDERHTRQQATGQTPARVRARKSGPPPSGNSNLGKLKGRAAEAAREARTEGPVTDHQPFRLWRWAGHPWLFAGLLAVSVVADVLNQLQDCPHGCGFSVWWSELGFEWLFKLVLGVILFFEVRSQSRNGKWHWLVLWHSVAAFTVVDSWMEWGVMAIVFEILEAFADDE
jgi:hypothetical protein